MPEVVAEKTVDSVAAEVEVGAAVAVAVGVVVVAVESLSKCQRLAVQRLQHLLPDLGSFVSVIARSFDRVPKNVYNIAKVSGKQQVMRAILEYFTSLAGGKHPLGCYLRKCSVRGVM